MKRTIKPSLEDILKDRQPVKHVPQGSPLAGPVTVSSLETGEVIRIDQPWSPAKRDTPGYTIEQHTGQKAVDKVTATTETEEEA
jgi:hypothetical protein